MFCHELCAATRQAVFSHHDDARDLQLSKHMLTVIVSLNDNQSGVKLYHFEPQWFTHTGDAVIFRGHALDCCSIWTRKDSARGSTHAGTPENEACTQLGVSG